jgi:hypothetical protein
MSSPDEPSSIGAEVRVMDENGAPGMPGPEWPGRVARILGRDAVEIEYAGYTETFSLPGGRSGSRYFLRRAS